MNKPIFKLFYCKVACIIFFVFFIILLAGCNQKITGNSTKDVPIEMAKNPEVYFCPREDCGKVYEGYIKFANFSVHCAFYDINLKNIISSLAKKSKYADVKIVMDSSNYKEQVKGDGVRMNNNNKDEQLLHNKFCVIDSGIVITGSFNPTDNDNYRNNNNIVVIYSKTLAKNYEDEFNELWNGEFGKGSSVERPLFYLNNKTIENYFCPEDKCASHLMDKIKNAKSSVYFMAFSFTNEGIAGSLIGKEGLDIGGIFDAVQSSNKFSQFNRLKELGIDVKKDKNQYKMHHKVFIIDNQTVATGSFNPTSNADTKNDENLLIMHDKKIADAFLKEFDNLWS